MHNVGGNWTALPERGPLNINEHVDFYAKVSLNPGDRELETVPTDR